MIKFKMKFDGNRSKRQEEDQLKKDIESELRSAGLKNVQTHLIKTFGKPKVVLEGDDSELKKAQEIVDRFD